MDIGNKKVIIVGGVAGGASTAARLRRLNENAEIVMFEKGEYISFANCGLPYYIGGVIKERENLLVQTVEQMSKKFNMDIRNFSEVIKIDRDNKKVVVKNHLTEEIYEEDYDVLVLSPGAQPIKPPIKGIEDAENLFTLRNIPDTDKIKSYVDTKDIKHATVIGGGFIGLEMAENLHKRGIKVTLVEASSQVMAPLDEEMVSVIHDHLIEKKVELILNDGVAAFENKGHKVILSSGREVVTDMIILSIGVKPETAIAKEAGLKLNERGAIVVDKFMKTSEPSIYALGDAAEVQDFVNKQQTMIPLAWPANRQGRIVADNIFGRKTEYKGTLGSSVAKVFDYTVATTGNNEKTLKKLGLEYQAIHIHPNSHAGYYPYASPIAYKFLFNPKTGTIYGAQGVGIDGVEKRIDIIATAIKAGLKADELQDVEPCYAPPYNSAKDPVNMMGYYAENIMAGLVKTIQWNEVDEIDKGASVILDVRDEIELATGEITDSVNIPLGQLRKRINEIPKNKKIYVTCQVGLRGYLACRILEANGFECFNIDGGVKTYLSVKRAEQSRESQQCNKEIGDHESAVMSMGEVEMKDVSAKITIDACGLQCPGPIRKVYEEINKMQEGEVLKISASDPGFGKDIRSWCEKTGNTLLKGETNEEKVFEAFIEKGKKNNAIEAGCCEASNAVVADKTGATMVVFSGDLDKAIASFIIATGAASMGKEVTMFFTFWGLNILKKKDKPKVEKKAMEKMFDVMLPGHPGKLPLSQMNMMGMGSAMIKKIMKDNNVDSLEVLIENAIKMGVKVVACSMSMDLMGIKKEEFIDGVEIGGVASYLGAADDSGLNLFI